VVGMKAEKSTPGLLGVTRPQGHCQAASLEPGVLGKWRTCVALMPLIKEDAGRGAGCPPRLFLSCVFFLGWGREESLNGGS
jgi:hypothetical protein